MPLRALQHPRGRGRARCSTGQRVSWQRSAAPARHTSSPTSTTSTGRGTTPARPPTHTSLPQRACSTRSPSSPVGFRRTARRSCSLDRRPRPGAGRPGHDRVRERALARDHDPSAPRPKRPAAGARRIGAGPLPPRASRARRRGGRAPRGDRRRAGGGAADGGAPRGRSVRRGDSTAPRAGRRRRRAPAPGRHSLVARAGPVRHGVPRPPRRPLTGGDAHPTRGAS